MKEIKSTFVDRFANFVCDNEDVSTAQIRSDLQEDGVNVDGFMGRVRMLVAEQTSAAIRANAEIEITKARERNDDVSRQVSQYSREELLRTYLAAQSGQMGHSGQEIALAARNASGDEPDTEELQALIHDILRSRDQDKQS
ncbi:MAG: hypothetical protein PF904_19440 [Kiritimatiellae bacterium]|jgi:hypothetical protein|nr:hypothetical protein [Kiritimatiellia bacterium]